MRTYGVVVASPVFDHDLCLLQCVEDFSVEQFITQFAVEALAIAVRPSLENNSASCDIEKSQPSAAAARAGMPAVIASTIR